MTVYIETERLRLRDWEENVVNAIKQMSPNSVLIVIFVFQAQLIQ